MSRELIGYVGVDSGQLMVTDPCYLDDWKDDSLDWGSIGTDKHKGEYSYAGACEATLSDPPYGQLNYALGHAGAGVAIGGFGGDGTFPVYAERDKSGMVVRVIIDFGWDDEE